MINCYFYPPRTHRHLHSFPTRRSSDLVSPRCRWRKPNATRPQSSRPRRRSEEHTSELQSRGHLVCRLLLEKKKPDRVFKENPLIGSSAFPFLTSVSIPALNVSVF